MAYGRTPKAINQVKKLLDEMVEANSSIEWSFNHPQKVQYKIWEAIRYANLVPNKYPQYTTLLKKYRIKIIEPDIVKAELRDLPRHIPITPNGTIIRDVSSVLDIIETTIKLKLNNLIFPEINELDEEDFNTLTKWCESNSYSFEFDNHNRLQLVREQ